MNPSRSGVGMLPADAPDLTAKVCQPAAHDDHVQIGLNYRTSNELASLSKEKLFAARLQPVRDTARLDSRSTVPCINNE